MADEPNDPMTPLGTEGPGAAEALDDRKAEHLEALGAADKNLPDMTDTDQWRAAPKDGGGA